MTDSELIMQLECEEGVLGSCEEVEHLGLASENCKFWSRA